jgi:hypothetical protein
MTVIIFNLIFQTEVRKDESDYKMHQVLTNFMAMEKMAKAKTDPIEKATKIAF